MRHIVFLTALLCTVALHAQITYVVSIGVANYAYINDLRYTETDVASFNKVMQRHTKEIYTLTGRQATHANVLATMQRVFGKADKGDAVVLFFSGHGYPGGFCCYDMSARTEQGGLSYKELQTVFKSCKAGRKMVFADACFSGGMRSKKGEATQAVRDGDVMFFLSSRTNETSQEMMGGPNGQYTRFLVRGLGGGADKNRDKIITAKELYDFVHEGVTTATANAQHPVMWGRFNNTMTVLDWGKK